MNDARGHGTTTQQMQSAPRSAVFVWCNTKLAYPRALARHLGRNDLRIVSPLWVAPGVMDGCAFQIVVDHCAELSMKQRDEVRIINRFVKMRKCARFQSDLDAARASGMAASAIAAMNRNITKG